MFELPQAKRVRREDLQSSSSSPSPTPDPEDRQHVAERLNAVLGSLNYEEIQAPITDDVATGSVEEVEDDGLEFRLFARPAIKPATTDASTGTEKPVARIRLGSEEDPDRPAGFIIPHRPDKYYFRPPPTRKDLARLHAAAIDASLIHKLSRIPWPGTSIPWRVTHHTLSSKQVRALTISRGTNIAISSLPEDDKPKRRRKGKKARILIRRKTASVRIRKELDAMNEQQRQEVEREKRAKNNRKKQLKKREKARALKAAAEGEGGGGGQDEDGGIDGNGQAETGDAIEVS